MKDLAEQEHKNELNIKDLVQRASLISGGIVDVIVIATKDISVEDDLANMCREPRCAFYGLSANCPPNVASPAEFRDVLNNCHDALAIKLDVPPGWLMSDERLLIMKLLHEIVSDLERAAVELGYSNSKGLAAGSCKEIFCNKHLSCRMLTDNGTCRNPLHARPSIEAFGVNVHELNKTAGWFKFPGDLDEEKSDKEAGEAIYGLVIIG